MEFFRVLYSTDAACSTPKFQDGALSVCRASRSMTVTSRSGLPVANLSMPQDPCRLVHAAKLDFGSLQLIVVCIADEDDITSGAAFMEPFDMKLHRQQEGRHEQGDGRTCAIGNEIRAQTRAISSTNEHLDSNAHVATNVEVGAVKSESQIRTEAHRGVSGSCAFVLNATAVAANLERPISIDAELAQHLRPHQCDGIRFMYEAVAKGQGCILADTMGLGKTLQAIGLAWALLTHGFPAKEVRKVVVVCPSSVCGNWRAEIRKWLGDQRLKPLVVTSGNARDRTDAQIRAFRDYSMHRMLILSYEHLRRHALLLNHACDLLVCDEGHRLRSQGTVTAKQLGAMQCTRRIILSGTPLQNNLEELFQCCQFVRPDLFPNANTFQRLIANPLVRSREPTATAEEREIGERASRELEALTVQFTLRRTAEVLEGTLPPRTEIVLRLRMAPPQVRAYRAVLGELHLERMLEQRDMALALKLILALRLLCNDADDVIMGAQQAAERNGNSHDGACQGHSRDTLDVKVEEDSSESERTLAEIKDLPQEVGFWKACAGNVFEAARLGASSKSAILLALLRHIQKDAPTDRVVLVSNFTRTLRRLQSLLHCQGIKTSMLCGSTPSTKRMQIVNSFNAAAWPGNTSTVQVLLLSCKAGGVGLNLIGANRLILYDPDWNPANDAQAMARIWRDGQSKNVFIYRFVLGGTVEEKICQRQHAKKDLFAVSIDSIGKGTGCCPRLSWDELRRVFELEGYDAQGSPTLCDPTVPTFGQAVSKDDVRMAEALITGSEIWGATLSAHIIPSKTSPEEPAVVTPDKKGNGVEIANVASPEHDDKALRTLLPTSGDSSAAVDHIISASPVSNDVPRIASKDSRRQIETRIQTSINTAQLLQDRFAPLRHDVRSLGQHPSGFSASPHPIASTTTFAKLAQSCSSFSPRAQVSLHAPLDHRRSRMVHRSRSPPQVSKHIGRRITVVGENGTRARSAAAQSDLDSKNARTSSESHCCYIR